MILLLTVNKQSQYRKYLGILANLQNLRLQEYKVSPNRSTNITRIFPPTYYITEIRQILPFLPHLAHIEICLFADYGSPDYSDDSAEESCSCCRRGFLSDMKADYAFSVIRAVGGAHVVLNGDCTFR
jgi:hypothetical protein